MRTLLLRALSALAIVTVWACSSSTVAVNPVAPTPTPNSITVLCCTWTFFNPQQLQPSATGHYADGTTRNLTTVVTWQSSDPRIAAVNGPGTLILLANPCGNGTTVISATYQGIVGSAVLTLPWDIGPGC